jgi:hypothetical protein
MNNNLSFRIKIIILIVEYFFFFFVYSTLDFFIDNFIFQNPINPWLYRFLVYIIYFTLSEFFFQKTLIMYFFKVKISSGSKSYVKSFWVYSFYVFLDRVFFLHIYFITMLLNLNYNYLLSEKKSGLKWAYFTR